MEYNFETTNLIKHKVTLTEDDIKLAIVAYIENAYPIFRGAINVSMINFDIRHNLIRNLTIKIVK